MELERTWIVKFKMTGPLSIPEVPITGPEVYTQDDVDRLHQRLRNVPLDSPRQLVNVTLEDGALVGFLETSVEPSDDERKAIFRHVLAALLPYRRPKRFEWLGTYPVTMGPVEYLPS